IYLLHLLHHVYKLRIVELVAPKIIHEQEAAAIEILPEILDIGGKEVQIPRFGHIDEWIKEQVFAVDIDDLILFRICLSRRQPAKRRRKHRIAIRVIVMPWDFAHPDRDHVIPDPGVYKGAAIDVAWRG